MPAQQLSQEPVEQQAQTQHPWLEPLCDRIASGEAIREICLDKDMPGHTKVYQLMARDEGVRTAITRAREAQQEYEADKIIEMADNATEEDWQVVKLRIWARQWRAAKLAPKKYGDRQVVEHEGNVAVEHRHVVDPRQLPDNARELVRQAALAISAPVIEGEAWEVEE